MSIGIFISYNHEDKRIAEALKACLVALSDKIAAHIDHALIAPGDDYEKKISDSINASNWFIMINPGDASNERDMDWCIYEAGQFRNRLACSEVAERSIVERMCVVYDVNIPPPLARYQSIRVQDCTFNGERLDLSADSLHIENTSVYQLFATILRRGEDGVALRDLSDTAVRTHVRNQVRAFIDVFLNAQVGRRLPEVTLQPRISLMMELPATGTPLTDVDPRFEVTGWEKALPEIFGIAGSKTTWGQIKAAFRLRSGADALWLQDVEDALLGVAADKVPDQTNMLIRARNGSLFRPVVTRYIPFASRRREVFISFIQTPQRSLLPTEATGFTYILPKQQVLLISLLFAFRFKQRVLPLVEAAARANSDRERLKALLMRIEREIMIIENEAEEYGFDVSEDHMDRPQITDSISVESDQEDVRRIVIEWNLVRTKLVAWLSDLRNPNSRTGAADVSDEVIQGLAAMRKPNKLFTEIIVRELARSQELDLTPLARMRPAPVGLVGSAAN